MTSPIFPTNLPFRVNDPNKITPIPTDLHKYWRNQAEEGYLERYWPDAEDNTWITNIRTILSRHFPALADCKITYFNKGTFNRLYKLTSTTWEGKAYLFRISIPVDPFFKTESEVATMEYVRRHSSMPVPRVIGYSSSDDNELGHEWSIIEMMPGQPLRTCWPTMDEDSRAAVFSELAEHVKQLVSLRFSKYGNIYFSDIAHRVLPGAEQPAGLTTTGFQGVVDRDVATKSPVADTSAILAVAESDMMSTVAESPFLSAIADSDMMSSVVEMQDASRTPPRSSLKSSDDGDFVVDKDMGAGAFHELIAARLSLLEQRLHDLSPVPGRPWYCENDRELHLHHPRVLDIFKRFKTLTPRFIGPQSNTPYPEDEAILWHDDLSEHNLLLDPATYKLTAVLDWEAVSVLPAYEAFDARPAWISDKDWRPTTLVRYGRGEGNNEAWLEAERIRREEEMGKAREVYHGIVGSLYRGGDGDEEMRKRVADKQAVALHMSIYMFQIRTWATEEWMKREGYWEEVGEEGKGGDDMAGSVGTGETDDAQDDERAMD